LRASVDARAARPATDSLAAVTVDMARCRASAACVYNRAGAASDECESLAPLRPLYPK
jgi:hypothetical protein